jgi:hypothetical protein
MSAVPFFKPAEHTEPLYLNSIIIAL